ncbi:alpha-galactosidase [Pedococcus sp. 5OH_020]|uniref:alpha-galactosidase n=1 Tax=Pedococcus sp. 5OH_020 TaxID=2989814 RepID=UPI0022E9FC36|nr:alpha-galactosidase [Pedococcus sp. 5OH_020]
MTILIGGRTPLWLPGDDPAAQHAHSLDSPVPGLQLTLTTGADANVPPSETTYHDGIVTLRVNADQLVRVTALIQTRDAVALWRPGSARDHTRIPASWEQPETVSPLSGMALGCLLADGDQSIVTYGASPGDRPLRVRAGLVEESAELLVSFEIDGKSGESPLRVHLDLAGRGFVESVQEMTRRLSGPRPRPAVDDERPVLCTWYFLQQAIDGEVLMGYAEPASQLGFGTLIVDDGWQTADTARGYGSAGDWSVSATKIADAARMVERFTTYNIRTMWWIGTPFIGHRSQAVSHLPIVADDPSMHAAVLDSRSESARRHLVERVVQLVRTTGAHGVKIDFLERFAGQALPEGIEAGALNLLDDLGLGLDAVLPGASIEFREPYIGPSSTARATMLRVMDCPMSPIQNRIGILDLRLATVGVAIHSDPIMWADADSPARVGQHLINALFGVPQISMDLLALSERHTQVLAFWLRIINEYRHVLLHGEFQPERPELNYPLVHGSADGTTITARYSPSTLHEPARGWSRWLIANADSATVALEAASGITRATRIRIVVQDPSGVVRTDDTYDSLPSRITVPTGGLATVERL